LEEKVMSASCAIVIEMLENGTYRATCPVFPNLEAFGKTEEAARMGLEEAIGSHLQERQLIY
jgi:predicted RNase H-like HicB family nuclease